MSFRFSAETVWDNLLETCLVNAVSAVVHTPDSLFLNIDAVEVWCVSILLFE